MSCKRRYLYIAALTFGSPEGCCLALDRAIMSGQADKFAAVRAALRVDSPLWYIQHIDLTCDGCECEPIEGQRYARTTPAMHTASQQSTETSDRLLPAAAAAALPPPPASLPPTCVCAGASCLAGTSAACAKTSTCVAPACEPWWQLASRCRKRRHSSPHRTPPTRCVGAPPLCVASAFLYKVGLRGSC